MLPDNDVQTFDLTGAAAPAGLGCYLLKKSKKKLSRNLVEVEK
jgi:hypothetical protein